MHKGVNGDDTKRILLPVLPELRALNLFHIRPCAPFLLVQTAESDNIKINQLFFPYCINNRNSRAKLRSSKPKARSAELDLVFSHHVSVPSVRGAGSVTCNVPGPWWCDGSEPLEISSPFSSLTFLATASFCS